MCYIRGPLLFFINPNHDGHHPYTANPPPPGRGHYLGKLLARLCPQLCGWILCLICCLGLMLMIILGSYCIHNSSSDSVCNGRSGALGLLISGVIVFPYFVCISCIAFCYCIYLVFDEEVSAD
eukprot:TRINITY_DN16474_c0_g1_i1.p1 TRINITY_DN16474_c0_g1~~TRINITY_DN16474_c0_g1_i1.p1  ORF type:complete len:123 (+),score=4.83 TRINITY_DN16474_c0_g1_i1:87-455(+)